MKCAKLPALRQIELMLGLYDSGVGFADANARQNILGMLRANIVAAHPAFPDGSIVMDTLRHDTVCTNSNFHGSSLVPDWQ